MDNSHEILFWILAMLSSAFFSGVEEAFITSDRFRHAISKDKKGFFFFMLKEAYSNPKRFKATLTLGNLVSLILIVYFSMSVSEKYIQEHIYNNPFVVVIFQILFSSVVIFIIGELIPRTLSAINPNFWLNVFILPAFIIYIILYPVVKAFFVLSKFFLSLFGIKYKVVKERMLSRDDLDSYVKRHFEDSSQEAKVESEVKIFKKAMEFSETKLRECMVPRADIVATEIDTDVDELKTLFVEYGLSKIMIYQDNIDNILGYIHVREMFNNPNDWKSSIREVLFYPESMQANKLMSDLMQQRKSVAVVVDEFGGTSGIITMEDLVEEIFGEIEDEYDLESIKAQKESENVYIIPARMEIDLLNEKFSLRLPESDDYSTVAGYILHKLQRFPKLNETVVIDDFSFKILKLTSRKIELVRLSLGESTMP